MGTLIIALSGLIFTNLFFFKFAYDSKSDLTQILCSATAAFLVVSPEESVVNNFIISYTLAVRC